MVSKAQLLNRYRVMVRNGAQYTRSLVRVTQELQYRKVRRAMTMPTSFVIRVCRILYIHCLPESEMIPIHAFNSLYGFWSGLLHE